jgi:choline kinase
LIRHPQKNCIVVDADILLNQEEIKVIAQNGHVEKISKELDPQRSLGEAIGLYKISRVLIPDLIRLYDGLEEGGELHHFFEKGFDKICMDGGGENRLFGISFTQRRPWVEIDTIEDFDYARREIFPRICG